MSLNFLGHMLNESATTLRRCQGFAFGCDTHQMLTGPYPFPEI